MKKVRKIVFAALLFLTVIIFASCGSKKVKADDLLQSFLLPEDNKEVNTNFSVQSSLKYGDETYGLSWKSSDTDHLKISDTENKDSSTYTVEVVRPESDTIEVTLTVTLSIKKKNTASKDFKVRIAALDVYSFSNAFTFDKARAIVYEDFTLPTSYVIDKNVSSPKTATITWASSNTDLVQVEGNNKAKVSPQTIESKVEMTATFSYNNKTTSVKYPLTVYYPMTQEDALIYWYEHTGITQTLEGYVVAKGTYADNYGEGSVYVMDPSLKGGYYVYQAYISKEEFNALELGTYVVCTGATNTNYNGLIETNYGGTLTIDTKKEKINVEDYRYAMDNDLIGNVNSLYYRLSTPVSLTNWKITKVTNLETGKSTQTILELEKFGVTTKIVYSKYFLDTPADASNDTYKAVSEQLKGLKVGDWVSVKGILSYYNTSKTTFDQKSYQIAITDAKSIVAGQEDTETTSLATKVKAQIEAVNKEMAKHSSIYADEAITLPVSSDKDVTITWGFANDYHDSAVIDEGKLVVTPGIPSNVFLTATFKNGDYTATVRYTIFTENVTEAEMVERELNNYSINDTVYTGTTTLPTAGTTHTNVKFTYELVGTYPAGLSITGNKLTLPTVAQEIEIVVKVTATLGENSSSKEIKLYLAVPVKCETIEDVYKKDAGTAVEVTATVVSVISNGYVLWDGTTAVYVDQAKHTFKVNDVVNVKGIWKYYVNGSGVEYPTRVRIVDIIDAQKVTDKEPVAAPKDPVAYDLAKLKEYVNAKQVPVVYASYTGVVSVSGNYVNIILEGSEENEAVQGSLSFVNDDAKKEIQALNGLKVKFTGWLYDQSSGKFPYLIMEKYDVLDEINDEFAVNYAKAEVEALAKAEVKADLDLPATVSVPKYEGNLVITWKNGEEAITKLLYDAPAEAKTVSLTAVIKAGEKDETVTVKFTVAAKQPEVGGIDITSKVTIANGVVTIPYGAMEEGAKTYVIQVATGKTIKIVVSDLVLKDSFKEFGLPKATNMVITAEGVSIYALISDVYGSYDDMKTYAAATATGTAVNGNKETSSFSNGNKFTYNFADGTAVVCFDNPSNYEVDFYQLALAIEPTGSVTPTPVESFTGVVTDLGFKDSTSNVRCYALVQNAEGKAYVVNYVVNVDATNTADAIHASWNAKFIAGNIVTLGDGTITPHMGLNQWVLTSLDNVTLGEVGTMPEFLDITAKVTAGDDLTSLQGVLVKVTGTCVVSGSNTYIQTAEGKKILVYYDRAFENAPNPAVLKNGGKYTVCGFVNWYNSAQVTPINSDAVTVIEEPTETPVDPVKADATISFDNLDNRTSTSSTTQQVWIQNGITVTNDKAASTNDINLDYYNPVRFYKNSNITIAAEKEFTTLVFHYSGNYFPSELVVEGCTFTLDEANKTFTLTLSTPSKSLKIIGLSSQWRFTSIDVVYAE